MNKTFGVDISYANGNTDFAALKNAGVKFVILRAGYGNDLTHQDDAQFAANLQKCREHQIPYGIYLYSYAQNMDMAQSEVKHTLRLLKGTDPVYGVWYDLEDAGLPSGKALIDIAEYFCRSIQEAGYYSGIYANLYWLNNRLNDAALDKYPKWAAQYNGECTFEKPYDIWQFTDAYLIGGKKFDGNYAYRDFIGEFGQKPETKPSEPAVTKPAAIDPKYYTYTVQQGDTLSGIAARYGTTYQRLAQINGIADPNLIYPGQVLKIN